MRSGCFMQANAPGRLTTPAFSDKNRKWLKRVPHRKDDVDEEEEEEASDFSSEAPESEDDGDEFGDSSSAYESDDGAFTDY
jgi:hypothetical protein